MPRGRAEQRAFTALFVQASAFVAKRRGAAAVRLPRLLAACDDVDALRAAHPAFTWHVLREAEHDSDDDGSDDGSDAAAAAVVPLASPRVIELGITDEEGDCVVAAEAEAPAEQTVAMQEGDDAVAEDSWGAWAADAEAADDDAADAEAAAPLQVDTYLF